LLTPGFSAAINTNHSSEEVAEQIWRSREANVPKINQSLERTSLYVK